jgi:pilus assembly protein FimV
MSRQVIQASIIVLALTGTDAFALGLGGLRTESALNQPFAGEIDLFDVKPDELDTVKAVLASADAFAKSGVERYHFLTGLTFEAGVSARGGAVIRVTSREPIREPFLDFLVEVVWPAGQLVKEFTALLDPPSSTEQRAPGVLQPTVSDRRPAPVPQRSVPPPQPSAIPERSAQVSAAERAIERPAGPDGFPMRFGPVRPGTGLLRLAGAGQPTGATRAQTALALYRNNQDAFINGDIDRLSVGRILVIPTRAELFALEPAAAARELQAALQGEPVRRSPMTDVARIDDAAAEGARLRIAGVAAGAVAGTLEVPVPQATPEPATSPTTDSTPASDIERDLLLVMEANEAARQETDELRGRILELETQLADIQSLLQLRNTELARLQGGASSADTVIVDEVIPDAASDIVVVETDAAAPDATVPTDGLPDAAATDATPAESRPAEDAVPAAVLAVEEVKEVEEVEIAAETEPADQSTWHVYLLPLAGFAGVTALGVIAFSLVTARRRRREQDAEEEEWTFSSEALDLKEGEDAGLTSAPVPARGDAAQVAPSALPAEPEPRESERKGGATPEPAIDSAIVAPSSQIASLGQFEAETDEADALSEADIYLAYGRYKEAEDLLKREMTRSPERLDVRFKLAEVYAGSENPDAMRKLMQDLKMRGADNAEPQRWQRLSAIAAVVEQGGTWDPGATLPITEATGAPQGLSPLDLHALEGGDSVPDPFRDAGLGDSFTLDISDLESEAPRARAPQAASPLAAASEPTADDALPLLFDDTALDEALDVPDLSSLSDMPDLPDLPDPSRPDEHARQSAPPATDLILTLDDLRDSRDLDLDAFLEGKPVPDALSMTESPASAPVESLPRLDLPEDGPDSARSAGDRDASPRDLAGTSDDALSGQWAMDSGIWDENATKLDLARAYIDMDDLASARDILQEVTADGRDEQRSEAQDLLRTLG